MNQPGSQLEALCSQAHREILLVAPFIKVNTLAGYSIPSVNSVKVQCVTRWRPDEIAIGVSDLDVWLLIKERRDSSLWLRSDLHAKYYRGDDEVLVGSANLTDAALGWSHHPNLELLIASTKLGDFEQQLFKGSVPVDDSLYERMKQIVQSMALQPPPKPDLSRY